MRASQEGVALSTIKGAPLAVTWPVPGGFSGLVDSVGDAVDAVPDAAGVETAVTVGVSATAAAAGTIAAVGVSATAAAAGTMATVGVSATATDAATTAGVGARPTACWTVGMAAGV